MPSSFSAAPSAVGTNAVAPSEKDYERQSDETFTDRLIRGSVYCGTCGYNLRTLPYIYQCPECGASYNARPLTMKGVFLPQQAEMPRGMIFLLCCIGGAGVLFFDAFKPLDIWRLLGGIILTFFSAVEIPRQWKALGLYLKAKAIVRRIEREES